MIPGTVTEYPGDSKNRQFENIRSVRTEIILISLYCSYVRHSSDLLVLVAVCRR